MRYNGVTPILLFAVGVGLFFGLGACQKGAGVSQDEEGNLVVGAVEQTMTVERTVALTSRTLVLDGFHGAVSLVGTGGDAARLTFTKRARGRTLDDAVARLGRITLEEVGDGDLYQYVLRAQDPDLSAVDVVGEVPRATPLRIRLTSGQVVLSGVDGPVDVQLDGGTVSIGGAGESVAVTTRNGAVDVGMYRLPTGSTVHLRATNGNLTLTVPESVDARVDAQTGAGTITTKDLTFSNRRLDPDGAGGRFRGRLGAGAGVIDLRTETGSIVVQGGTVLHLPNAAPVEEMPPDTAMVPPDTLPGPSPDTTLLRDTSATAVQR